MNLAYKKNLGQIFTPNFLVKEILNLAGYLGKDILNKKIIDNSCGNGAFLCEIVKRYIKEFLKQSSDLTCLKNELENNIFGIEIDKTNLQNCYKNLNKITNKFSLKDINFNLILDNTLTCDKFNQKIDFVVGNPPYIRVHNLNNQYEKVKKFSFAKSGMSDIFIVFYELGLNMLKSGGTLCYISPNSFFTSLAGSEFRKFLQKTQSCEKICDLGHFMPFNAITYTAICKIVKDVKFKDIKYYKFNERKVEFQKNISYKNLFFDNKIILNSNKFSNVLKYENTEKALVKNAFATLNDSVFIADKFDFDFNQISIIKSSTGEIKKCIFPYDKKGKLIDFSKLNLATQKYLKSNKAKLDKASKDNVWWAFGRSQGIRDVYKNKIAINAIIKDINSIKLQKAPSSFGVYSGLYILSKEPFIKIAKIIKSDDFISYVRTINKPKNGGYFTFSSKDLSKFLNYYLDNFNE
ncbi:MULTISPECIES: Eco57I restriction-modification methylase domain-containing protein [unclassified Campylobacter]|uniref:Eco57I restriction-modification methylase domain-containing protein n=1 Tax=unclassified Campylobacter TaxID=2593542 RepID=UPI001237F687|nr:MULTISPECIES: Eco57I restriction-modification methylase domain-containing protein [unclassified Campylobacter]KAA6224566.1 SAM-dependent DNA methyltransferase [Campylobacter sp. LR185c]KAA6224913.1 SAM-dependent DNA methyltransferase [Campylobacter sp. LR196d]KAA6225410.1 SAM-dependent DNA methyltransferase [Campylobacter sp. LR286c]KAA6229114.1 SAM-dependent DNA methyltransferase [Campylobacter sp. LR291e]KAA6229598.1 SAM-dependent DNA methyltransferase [Campylobacter sp. LR264d]